ncbi:hypothetical protein [Nocardia sp. NPDC059239]
MLTLTFGEVIQRVPATLTKGALRTYGTHLTWPEQHCSERSISS